MLVLRVDFGVRKRVQALRLKVPTVRRKGMLPIIKGEVSQADMTVASAFYYLIPAFLLIALFWLDRSKRLTRPILIAICAAMAVAIGVGAVLIAHIRSAADVVALVIVIGVGFAAFAIASATAKIRGSGRL